MDFTRRQLEAVVEVAERRNISHAAVELAVSQPTVSRLVSRVEAIVGTPLFERDVNGAEPTRAGELFVEGAAEMLRRFDEVTDQIRSLEGRLVGKVCVAMPDTIGHTLFIPLIDRFARLHPDVELRVMASHPSNVPLALASGDADVGVISDAHRNPGVSGTPLAIEQLHLVSAAGHAVGRRKTQVRLSDLAGVPLVLPAIQPGLRNRIDAAFAQRQLRPSVVLEVDAEDALVELVSSGRAHSIMSFAGVQRFVGRGQLDAQVIVDPPIERLLSSAVPEGRAVTRLLATVADAIHDLAEELAPAAHWSIPAK
ncbi:MAG: LysR family transcriptional regulator [Actinomycetota bacterium]